MRFRMGKGQVIAFDAAIEKTLNALKQKNGFYPTLKEIGEKCAPPAVYSASYVDRALRRLAAAGKLTADAKLAYNSTKHKKEPRNEKTTKSRVKK